MTQLSYRQANRLLAPAIPLRLIYGLALVFLCVHFVRTGIDQARAAYDQTYSVATVDRTPLMWMNDFPAFFAGAEAAGSGEREDLYDVRSMVERISRVQERGLPPPGYSPDAIEYVWLRYYNPPLYLAALSPLTLFELQTAYLITIGLNLVLLAGLLVSLGYVLRWQQPHTLLLCLALFAYQPIYTSLHHAQPTILIALMLTCGYLALRNQRYWLAGITLALTGVKPHWLLPAAALLKSESRLRKPLIVSCFVLLALPFLWLGPSGIFDYVHLVTDRGDNDLYDEGFTTALLGWTGFFRAYTGEPQPQLWLLASLATVAAYLLIWWRASSGVVLAASALTALLVIPHSHPQDWVLLAPVAAILLSHEWRPLALAGIAAGLMAIWLGANDWRSAQMEMDSTGTGVYWVTLAGAGLLLWLTAVEAAAAISVIEPQARAASSFPEEQAAREIA